MWSSFGPEKPAALTQGEEILVIHYANELSEPPLGGGLSVPQQSSRSTRKGQISECGGGAREVLPSANVSLIDYSLFIL